MKFMVFIFVLVFLSLTTSGCGGNGNQSDVSAECTYYNKLKKGAAKNITAKGNEAVSSLQKEVIACSFNKSCRDTAIKNFGETHNCNQ